MIFPVPSVWAAAVAGVFWQSSTKGPPTDQYDSDIPVSSFGSYGRLFAVDATLTAVDRHSATSIVSLCCQDGVVTVVATTQSPYIHSRALVVDDTDTTVGWNDTVVGTPSSQPIITRLDDATSAPCAVVAGTGVDQVLLRSIIQEMAEGYFVERNSASAMARRLADALQLRTQQPSKGRVLVAACLLLDQQSIWNVDASGQFWKRQGVAIGRHAPEIEQALLRNAECLGSDDGIANPIEMIRNLTLTQAVAFARDSILSVYSKYQRSNITKTKIYKGDDMDTSTVQIRGFICSTQGIREFDHDFIMTIGHR